MRCPSPPSLSLGLALCALLLTGATGCGSDHDRALANRNFYFETPQWGLLSGETGPLAVSIHIPSSIVRLESLAVYMDGQPALSLAAGELSVVDGRATGEIPDVPLGVHVLEARAAVVLPFLVGAELHDESWLERIALDRPDDCEVLNDVECVLPFPSSRYLAEAETPTGYRVSYPEGVLPGMPLPLASAAFSGQDGFSPAVQILTHFPGGVDPALSRASRLQGETRSYDDRSLSLRSPTLLLDVDRGMQPVLHFVERDSRAATGDAPEREILFIRPAVTLEPGHRYIVAMRGLIRPDGSEVVPEPVFRALREGRPSDIPAVEARREHLEDVFRRLYRLGINIRRLDLAFDFVVQSEQGLTGEMLAMRDRAFDWLATQTGPTFDVQPFAAPGAEDTGDLSLEHDCSEPEQNTWRRLRGRFQVPLFLDSDPLLASAVAGRLVDDDGDGLPDAQGLMSANYEIVLPCAAQTADLPPLLSGHGLFGRGAQVAGFPSHMSEILTGYGLPPFDRISGATDWLGLSIFDFDITQPLTPSFVIHGLLLDADNFGALPDRLRQGMTNALVLGRMLKQGHFNAHPAFQRAGGAGVLPGPTAPLDYYGISLGGIMGTQLAALSPDVEHVGLNVPGQNFSILIQRSTAIGLISLVLNVLNPDAMSQAIFFGLAEELWDSAEPAGYLRNVTGSRLPGSGDAPNVLMSIARFDGIVANETSEISARTMGLVNLRDVATPSGSAVSGLVGIPDVAPPIAPDDATRRGAIVYHDFGMYDLSDPEILPYVPPLANKLSEKTSNCDPHGWNRSGASVQQMTHFLGASGEIESFCDGLCDALDSSGQPLPFELPPDLTEPCDPLTAPPPVFDR
jgi:hypothetical protein